MEKHYDHRRFEKDVLLWWKDLPKERLAKGKPFSVIMPPPNVTGSLHLGHALSDTFQDILVRWHRMQGRNVLWVPGTDHAGIATQMMVEKRLAAAGQSREALGRDAFLKKVWDWKHEHGDLILAQIQRLGFDADWDHMHFTLDADMNRGVNRAFVDLYNKGLIYRDNRLVHWDCRLKTVLSDLEVVNREEKGTLWSIDYVYDQDPGRTITVATTRPETLFGDVAIAVHPDDKRYQECIGQKVRIPIIDRCIPIVADLAADPDKGSGAVKITPAHDFTDFEVGQRHDLDAITVLDENGCMNNTVPEAFQGMDVLDARKAVLETLGDCVVGQETIMRSIPYSDRSGVVVEPRITLQWYVKTQGMAQKAKSAVTEGSVRFMPQEWTTNYMHWLDNIQPWCVSRQLWWGHQIPAWYGPENSVFVTHCEEEAYQQARQKFGDDVVLYRDEDVLDTWFSSGLWPFLTLGWPEKTALMQSMYPTNVLVTGFDIIFFWVARMMMLGLEITGQVPFYDVFIHPLIRDEKGQKMSKTKKNTINPLSIVDEYGADALRLALSSATSGKQYMNFGLKNVVNAQHFMTKVWNMVRFLKTKELVGVHTAHYLDTPPAAFSSALNRWLAHCLSDMLQTVQKYLASYRFSDAAMTIQHFVRHVFCDWFLEFFKHQWPSINDQEACDLYKETKHLLVWTAGVIVRALHPFMPFMTEVIWHEMTGQRGTLRTTSWPELSLDALEDKEAMDWLQGVISVVRRVRLDFSIHHSTPLRVTILDASPIQKTVLATYHDLVSRWIHLEVLTMSQDPVPGMTMPVGTTKIVIPLGHLVNIQDEKARMEKILDKEVQERDQVMQRLRTFSDHTPDDVVARAHDHIDRINEHIQTIQGMLSALSGNVSSE
jgi:valyl-tRNA synthetase